MGSQFTIYADNYLEEREATSNGNSVASGRSLGLDIGKFAKIY